MSYNLDEHLGDNHYNCPVVAYYPEVIAANMPAVRQIDFIHDYVGIDHRRVFPKKLTGILQQHFPDITAREVRHACDAAYNAYDAYMADVRQKGRRDDRAGAQRRPPASSCWSAAHIMSILKLTTASTS